MVHLFSYAIQVFFLTQNQPRNSNKTEMRKIWQSQKREKERKNEIR